MISLFSIAYWQESLSLQFTLYDERIIRIRKQIGDYEGNENLSFFINVLKDVHVSGVPFYDLLCIDGLHSSWWVWVFRQNFSPHPLVF